MAGTATINVRLDDEQLARIRAEMEAKIAPYADRWQQVRDLHKPDPTPDSDTVWCGECAWRYDPDDSWPCPTAKLVYSDDEIADHARS